MLQSIFSDVETHKSAIIYKKLKRSFDKTYCVWEFASHN